MNPSGVGGRRLKNTLFFKGAWQQVARTQDFVPHARLSQVALPLRRIRGKCSCAARLHHQRAEKTWKQGVDRIWRVPPVWFLPGPTTGTRRNLQHCRSYAGTLRLRSRCGVRHVTRRPRHHHGAQRARSIAIYFYHHCCPRTQRGPGRACGLHAAQQRLVEKPHKQLLIVNCPTAGENFQICVTRASIIVPLSGQQMGRPRPAATRTLQHTATSRPAATANKCQRNRCSTDGNMKYR